MWSDETCRARVIARFFRPRSAARRGRGGARIDARMIKRCALVLSATAVIAPSSWAQPATPGAASVVPQAVTDFVPRLLGRRIAPSVLYGVRICGLQRDHRTWTDALKYEESVGQADGTVNQAKVQEYEQKARDAQQKLEREKHAAKEHKVRPLPCANLQVYKINTCDPTRDDICRVFYDQSEALLNASLDAHGKHGVAKVAEDPRQQLVASNPSAAPEVDARVAAALSWLGVK